MLSHLTQHPSSLSSAAAVLLLAFLASPGRSGSAEELKGGSRSPGARGGLLAHLAPAVPEDRISEDVRSSIEASIAAYKRAGLALPAPKADLVYPFFPQAGILGQDLYIINFADLDPSRNILDWDCTGYTYDGHHGHDSSIRSFRAGGYRDLLGRCRLLAREMALPAGRQRRPTGRPSFYRRLQCLPDREPSAEPNPGNVCNPQPRPPDRS